MTLRAAVFASGGGTNLQALLDNETAGGPYRIELILSDREDAGALDRGRSAGRQARVIPVRGRDAEQVAGETVVALQQAEIDVVFLAGYMRLIPASVVGVFRRRILNVHPALLPSFGGKGMWGHHVHEAVLASGARFTGPTVHYVDEEYDSGSILAQWPVPVRPGDDADHLGARVLRVEHVLYPAVADHVCRALDAGVEPAPFSPSADVFLPAPDVSTDELRRRIESSFKRP
jgi:formyltetrahydrofolate-dependent phosphoribosylglycinamide formyltransferase